MLAGVYRQGIPLAGYWVSEKYDGIRAYWNGHQLLTRGGEVIPAPAWFTRGWPAREMDGELWGGYGRFAETVSIARQQAASEADWKTLRFMVFDLPAEPGTFDQRLEVLRRLVPGIGQPWVVAVSQKKVADHAALKKRMEEIVRAGGEGVVLHRGASYYKGERNDDLLKFKPHEDAEAKVVAYLPGKGKYEGMVGALLVETADGIQFRLGSGLTDALRATPPSIGSWVTYRYRGLHPSGKPRFAVFYRSRID